MKNIILATITFICCQIVLVAQEYKIGILPIATPTIKENRKTNGGGLNLFKSSYEQDYNAMLSAQSGIVQAFLNDSRFEVLDRTNVEFVDQELDRQKSESYMDGYVVEQGKQLGVQYISRSIYNVKDKLLTVKIFSVEDGSSLAEKTIKFKRNLLQETSFPKDVKEAVEHAIREVWPIEIVLYEATDSNDKVIKKVLAVSMSEINLKKNDKLLIYISEEKTIAGKKLMRDMVIGEAEVELKENDNFYIVKINKGKKEVRQYFDNNIQVKFKPKS